MHHQTLHPYAALLHAPLQLICFFYEPLVIGSRELTQEEPLGLYSVFNELMH